MALSYAEIGKMSMPEHKKRSQVLIIRLQNELQIEKMKKNAPIKKDFFPIGALLGC